MVTVADQPGRGAEVEVARLRCDNWGRFYREEQRAARWHRKNSEDDGQRDAPNPDDDQNTSSHRRYRSVQRRGKEAKTAFHWLGSKRKSPPVPSPRGRFMYKYEGPCPRIASIVGHDGPMPQPQTMSVVSNHLHVSRMSTYMAAAGGDPDLALRLYLWNTRVSAALFETLSVTEIIMRNAIDTALRNWNQSRPYGHYPAEWTTSAARPLNSLTKKAVETARAHAAKARAKRPQNHPRKHAPIDHNDIVAQLSFGVYARLMPTTDTTDHNYARREILWREALSGAFAGRPGDGKLAHAGRVERLHSLRNRIAHAEPILDVNFSSRVRDMARLVDSINPQLSGWVSGHTRVHAVAAMRPH